MCARDGSRTRLARGAALAAMAIACACAGSAQATGASERGPAAPVARASIVNGYVPHASQWPWIAALLYSPEHKPEATNDFDRQFCGGTLVRPKVVVTAAHCVTGPGMGPAAVDVLLGRRNLRESVGEKLDVAAVVVHPAYDPGTERNDVAMLHLATASTLAPAAIIDPATRLKEGRRATVMGWGALNNAAIYSPVLRAADVPLWSPKRCQRAWEGEYFASQMLCAGYLNGRVDSCNGDSGGPLMVLGASQWALLGIVSFGAKCAQPQMPGVYTWVNGPGIRQFVQGEMGKDPSPAGTGVAPETPGSQPTNPPGDDARPPRIGRIRLGVSRGALVARFSLSEAAQLSATLFRVRGGRVRGPVRRGARAGRTRMSLAGRLRPGRYRLLITAEDLALNRSARAVRLRVGS